MSTEPETEAEFVPYSGEVELPVLTSEPIVEKAPANPTLINYPLSGIDWDFAPPVSEVQLQIQEDLAHMDVYVGKKNGKWGNLTVFAIREVVGHPNDVPDRELCLLIQGYAAELGKHAGDNDIEGILTPEVWDAFARGLETTNPQD